MGELQERGKLGPLDLVGVQFEGGGDLKNGAGRQPLGRGEKSGGMAEK